MGDHGHWDHGTLRPQLQSLSLPAMLVNLDTLDANIDRIAAMCRAHGKTMRLATKSVRVPDLIRYILERGGKDTFRGLMCYSVKEALYLSEQGMDDFLVAYPHVDSAELSAVTALVRNRKTVTVMVDSADQADIYARHWRGSRDASALPPLRVCIDLDMSYRPLGGSVHLGVRRSAVLNDADLTALLNKLKSTPELTVVGMMGYEAQIAGVGETNPFSPLLNKVKWLMKKLSVLDVAGRRQRAAQIAKEHGINLEFFNGGGTGSLSTSVNERVLTEVTAGSGFLQSHLFDYYGSNKNEPAMAFALRVTRKPADGIVTCHSGGFIASGEIGQDKQPLPFLPEGLSLISTEGCGEVQTPLTYDGKQTQLNIGDAVLFRPAKAGEIAERFNEYYLIRSGRIDKSAKTYRGMGKTFF